MMEEIKVETPRLNLDAAQAMMRAACVTAETHLAALGGTFTPEEVADALAEHARTTSSVLTSTWGTNRQVAKRRAAEATAREENAADD